MLKFLNLNNKATRYHIGILLLTLLAVSGFITRCAYKADRRDYYIKQIKASSGSIVWSIIENSPDRNYSKESLTEESYIFAAEVEKTIFQLLLSTGGRIKTIAIIPNKYPSTVWRISSVKDVQKVFPDMNSTLLSATASRFNATRAADRFKRSKIIVDYKSYDCSGYRMFIKNLEAFSELLVPVMNSGEEELLNQYNLFYGVYCIIKFDDHPEYFIFSSHYSHQLDYYKNKDFTVLPSPRAFHVLKEKEFKSSKYYLYLAARTELANFFEEEE
jgi:hypothetical protein